MNIPCVNPKGSVHGRKMVMHLQMLEIGSCSLIGKYICARIHAPKSFLPVVFFSDLRWCYYYRDAKSLLCSRIFFISVHRNSETRWHSGCSANPSKSCAEDMMTERRLNQALPVFTIPNQPSVRLSGVVEIIRNALRSLIECGYLPWC